MVGEESGWRCVFVWWRGAPLILAWIGDERRTSTMAEEMAAVVWAVGVAGIDCGGIF